MERERWNGFHERIVHGSYGIEHDYGDCNGYQYRCSGRFCLRDSVGDGGCLVEIGSDHERSTGRFTRRCLLCWPFGCRRIAALYLEDYGWSAPRWHVA